MDDNDNWKPLSVAASKTLSPDSRKQKSEFEKAQVMRAARSLLGCYRTGDANDPEVYISAIVRVFSVYSIDVIHAVADPLTGLPSRVKWLPTVVEVREACEEAQHRARWLNEFNEGMKAQIEERRRVDEFKRLNPPKETWEQTKADLKRRGFHCGERPRKEITAAEIMAKHGVSQEQWDAIPNHEPDFELKATQSAEKAARR